MSFFVRKAFRFGPLRLNLSKSGIGVSAGIKGARLGLDSRGRPYVAGGRHGLYYREYIKTPGGTRSGGPGLPGGPPGGRSGSTPSSGRRQVTLWEPTGATFASETDHSAEPPIPAPSPPASPALPWVAGALAGFLLLVFLDGLGMLLGLTILVAAGAGGLRAIIRARRKERWLEELQAMVAAGRWDPDLARRIRAELGVSPGTPPPPGLKRELEGIYREACGILAEGTQVDEDEWELIQGLEELLGGPTPETRAVRADALRGLVAILATDHRITDEEWEILDRVREGLRLDHADLEEDLDLVIRLREMERIRQGELPEVESPIPLRRGETAHLTADGRLLRDRQLRRFQRGGVAHVVRGWVVEREGPLVVTDRRLLLLDGGAYEIPLREILDLEVDLDENLIQIVRDGRANPIVFTTPDALMAGAILARLSETR